ncbi:threonine aldolase family protein [Nocardia sp. NPDC004568]|uniref:threonine aldolase family protein n=1 Tax=Nocardia sp. NPDC004568 TaxID=3154551 RepID=UPI0033A22695
MRVSMHRIIDLRSDTVTKPTAAMRRAIAGADVGDDWYGDDPTVNLLQDRVAELTGKQAAAFLPTGTLCNQIAMHAYVRSGHFVVCEAQSHVCGMELHSAAALSGVAFRRVPARSHGQLTAEDLERSLEPDPYDVGVVDLVVVENTHQLGGGWPAPVASVAELAAVATARGVPLYLDGARLFNACAATGATVAEYATHSDALMLSLSKGMGAPIGSLLAGDADFIREVRRLKILFGAAWRQAGIMAAAGLVALDEGHERLISDHENARRLAAGVAEILPGSVDPSAVPTNIVFVDVTGTGRTPWQWAECLASVGVLVTAVPGRVRMLTHRDIGPADIDAVIAAWKRIESASVTEPEKTCPPHAGDCGGGGRRSRVAEGPISPSAAAATADRSSGISVSRSATPGGRGNYTSSGLAGGSLRAVGNTTDSASSDPRGHWRHRY